MQESRRTVRALSLVALGLLVLEAGILYGAVQLAKEGFIVPDALWILAVLVVGAVVYVASRLPRSG